MMAPIVSCRSGGSLRTASIASSNNLVMAPSISLAPRADEEALGLTKFLFCSIPKRVNSLLRNRGCGAQAAQLLILQNEPNFGCRGGRASHA
jgi:hypothetical protein